MRDVYEGPFESTLRWTYVSLVEPDSPSAFWDERPSGYEPVTSVRGSVTLGPTQFFAGRPALASYGPRDDCSDWYEVPVSVELATDDGAIAGTASGALVFGRGPTFLRASIDLAEAIGTLDLHLDRGVEYRGAAELQSPSIPKKSAGKFRFQSTQQIPWQISTTTTLSRRTFRMTAVA